MEDSTIFIICAIIYGAASEIIGMLPSIKSNSVIQLVLEILGKIFKKNS